MSKSLSRRSFLKGTVSMLAAAAVTGISGGSVKNFSHI